MAVLKDLIVHGPSRFLNTSYFNQLKTDKIGAEEGIFNKIVATTGDIGSLTVEDLTAGKATVLSLLDVRGELHTNQWTNSNIATIDGSFYITPTIGVPSGTMTTTTNSVVVNGSNFPISSLYVNGTNSDNTATTVAWTSSSKVLITGEILVNGTYMPLGTLVGILDGDATATQIKIKSITDNRYQTAESLAEIGTQSTALPCRNVKVSLYQTSRSSTLYPLGIFMTALGENGRTFLDIYGGGYATSTAVAGGFAKPVLRIGNLKDLPAVGGSTPTGYGIYTSNGYFSGTIVAKQGKIGDGTAAWTIGNDSNNRAYIYSGISNITTSGSTAGTYVGTNGISNYASTTQYVNLTGGKITAQGADIAGKITATSGSIAGWRIESTYLASGSATSPAANVLLLSPSGTSSSYTVAGQAKTGWVITAGTTFGVNKDGGVYATSGKIGGFDIGTSNIRNGNITGANNTSVAGVYLGTDGLNISGGTATSTAYIYKNGSSISVNIGNKLTWNGTTLAIDGAATIGGTTASTVVSNAANGASAKDAIDNLEIGGRNLLRDTRDFIRRITGTVMGAMQTSSTGSLLTEKYQNCVIRHVQTSDSYVDLCYWGYLPPPLLGEDYVESFWVKGSGQIQLIYYGSENNVTMRGSDGITASVTNGHFAMNIPAEWTRVWVHFHSNMDHSSTRNVYVRVLANSDAYVCGVKFEKGNKPSAWSPAPEDIDVHEYVTDIDSNNGITIKPINTTGNDYLQINSTSIDFYRGIGTNSAAVSVMSLSDSVFRMGTTSGNHTTVDSNGLNVYKGSETAANKVATFGSSIALASNEATVTIGSTSKYHTVLSNTAMEFKNGANTTNATLMSISGNVITLYKPNTTTAAATLNSNGLVIASGSITLGSNFSVNSSGSLTATGATLKNITLQDSNSKTRATVDTNGLKIFDASSNLKAQFGTDIDLYGGSSATGAMPKININATNGITIAQSTTNKAVIDGSGMQIYVENASIPVAQFGDIIQIGSKGKPHSVISSESFVVQNEDDVTVFECSNSNATKVSKRADIISQTIGDGFIHVLEGTPISGSNILVQLGKPVGETVSFTYGTSQTINDSETGVKIVYTSPKTFNFQSTSNEGRVTNIKAISYEINSTAPTLTYGSTSGGAAAYSATFGINLWAEKENQFIIGKNNDYVSTDNKVFLIGNGSSSNSRSNALTVDWDGNLTASGNIRAVTEVVALTPNSSYFAKYTGSPYTTNTDIKLRRFGNVVSITGMVKPTTTITGSDTEYTICTIPSSYSSWYPPQVVIQIMQGSTQYKWCLKINTSGTVTFSRYSATTSYAQVTTSTWLPFHATWIVDS